MAKSSTKKTGSFMGKSNSLGQGGRAAQLKAQGVPGAVIGAIARSKGAAPGQPNFHRKAKRAADDPNKTDADNLKQDEEANINSKSRKMRKAKRPIEDQPKALALEKEPDVVATPTGKKLTEGFRKRAHRAAPKKRGLGNAIAKVTGWPKGINDVSLNKSGTVGTEPISKGNNKFTELKAGPLGKVDVPMGTLKRKGSVPQRRTHRSMSGLDLLTKATKGKC